MLPYMDMPTLAHLGRQLRHAALQTPDPEDLASQPNKPTKGREN